MWLYWFGRIIIFLPMLLLFPTKVFGDKKIEKGRPTMLVSNHISGWDIFLLGSKFSRPVCFMAKAELYKNWFLIWLFNTLKCIPVKRGEADIKAVRETLKRIEDGYVFGIFPEGTRNRGNLDEIGELKHGAAMFAIKSKSVIYPCSIKYKMRPFKKNYIIKGEPFELSEFYGKPIRSDLLDEATKVIDVKLREVQKLMNEKIASKAKK